MGWFDRFFKNKKQVSLQDKFEMKLILRDEFYILKELDIKFKRELARNGYPDNDGCSGFISCTLYGTVGKQLQAWAVYADKREDGEIRVYNAQGDNECVFSLSFLDANCLCMHTKTLCALKENRIRIIIAPRIFNFGAEALINEWR